jgi:hypothetical protein
LRDERVRHHRHVQLFVFWALVGFGSSQRGSFLHLVSPA